MAGNGEEEDEEGGFYRGGPALASKKDSCVGCKQIPVSSSASASASGVGVVLC